MPNIFLNSGTKPPYEVRDIPPSLTIYLFVLVSKVFNIFDYKIVEWSLKISIFSYIFMPLFGFIDSTNTLFIANYFYSIIKDTNYQMLSTLYLIAPLIGLYFKEHSLIMDEFVAHYNQETQETQETQENNVSILDKDKDAYDSESLGIHMSRIVFNERLIKYDVVRSYIKWVKIVGNKRRNSMNYMRGKLLILVSLLMIGVPMTLTDPSSQYYLFSISVFIFIMIIIFTQIIYSARSMLKLVLLSWATHAAYYFYEKMK